VDIGNEPHSGPGSTSSRLNFPLGLFDKPVYIRVAKTFRGDL
jgi:hypothetical protein